MQELNYSQSYIQTKLLHHLVVRVAKNNSVFVYFTLESNEGLCFYSTLDDSLSTLYRDIDLTVTPEFYENLKQLLASLQKLFPLEIIVDEVKSDL